MSDMMSESSCSAAKLCKSCGQKFGDWDEDHLPQLVQLKWAKLSKDENGKRSVPDGDECKECLCVRTNSLGSITLDTSQALRAQNEDPWVFSHDNTMLTKRLV